MYHEKQIGNYCRCHAINNLMGKQICSRKEFDILCDEFDAMNGFTQSSSKLKYIFYNNGGIHNIFGHVLTKKGNVIRMEHHDYYSSKAICLQDHSLQGIILYNRSHTYCLRPTKTGYVIIDSMRTTMQPITIKAFCKPRNIGAISVFMSPRTVALP